MSDYDESNQIINEPTERVGGCGSAEKVNAVVMGRLTNLFDFCFVLYRMCSVEEEA